MSWHRYRPISGPASWPDFRPGCTWWRTDGLTVAPYWFLLRLRPAPDSVPMTSGTSALSPTAPPCPTLLTESPDQPREPRAPTHSPDGDRADDNHRRPIPCAAAPNSLPSDIVHTVATKNGPLHSGWRRHFGWLDGRSSFEGSHDPVEGLRTTISGFSAATAYLGRAGQLAAVQRRETSCAAASFAQRAPLVCHVAVPRPATQTRHRRTMSSTTYGQERAGLEQLSIGRRHRRRPRRAAS
jgi:hypothetical protein